MVSSRQNQHKGGGRKAEARAPPLPEPRFSHLYNGGAPSTAGGRVVELGAEHRRKSHGGRRLAKMSAWACKHGIVATFEIGGMGWAGYCRGPRKRAKAPRGEGRAEGSGLRWAEEPGRGLLGGGTKTPSEVTAPWLLVLPLRLQAALPSPSLRRSSGPVLPSQALQRTWGRPSPVLRAEHPAPTPRPPLPALVLHDQPGSGHKGGSPPHRG